VKSYIYRGGSSRNRISQIRQYVPSTHIHQDTQFHSNLSRSSTMSSPRALLITGATGKQGGSVINALLKANAPFEILALTRNAQSASAQRLLKKSPKIKLVTGDFNALDDVFRKAKEASSAPIWGVFSVTVRLHPQPHVTYMTMLTNTPRCPARLKNPTENASSTPQLQTRYLTSSSHPSTAA
jgi:hypothetical protein